MAVLNKKEMIIRYGTIGLVLGALLTCIVYLIVFFALEQEFSLSAIAGLHSDLRLLYVVDIFLIPGIISGVAIGNWRFKQMDLLSSRIVKETEKNAEIKKFAHSLIAGELNTSISFSGSDKTLSDSLNKLKDTLVRNRELERQRRLEEKQRNWISEGLAQFGDILRTNSHDLETMAYAVISGMVRYLDANQGAIFLAEQEGQEKSLRMIACHAYDRKKFPDKRIQWGEGLVGAVAVEKKGFYTQKIPDGYLSITSGLGKANPNFLVIEPLLWNEKVFGTIEIASFKPLEEFRLHFISRVAENIATTINTMESNLRTENLLKETRAQADQLSSQEEKVRQNMEALKLTQEEAARQAEKFISFTNTVNHTLIRAEYDTGGNLIYANTKFLKMLGYSGNREVEGRHISIFLDQKDHTWFNALWEKLAQGGRHFQGYMKHVTKLGQDLWTMATYTCVRQDDGTIEKILFLAIDSTEQKKQSLDYESQIDAIDRLNAKAVFSPDGRYRLCNDLFSKTLKYTSVELDQMNVFDFFGPGEQERFNEIWENVIRGEGFQGQLKMQSKYEEDLWFRATFLSANDIYGEVEKVIFLANEITKEKEMENAARKQHDQLIRKEEELRLSILDLKKSLEESKRSLENEKLKLGNEIIKYRHVLDELPFPVISINNMGFVLLYNKCSERNLGIKAKEIIGSKADQLFDLEKSSDVIKSFTDPVRTKTPGNYPEQEFILSGGKMFKSDLMIITSDLGDELLFTLIVL